MVLDEPKSSEKQLLVGAYFSECDNDNIPSTFIFMSNAFKESDVTENDSDITIMLRLLALALPTILNFFLSHIGSFITLVFAGQFGDSIFAGVSLASLFVNVSSFSVLMGIGTAADTLCSQFNGAGNYQEVGFILIRSILVMILLTLPIFLLWNIADDLFLFIGVDVEVASVLDTFLRIRAISLPVDAIFISFESYLMALGITRPILISITTYLILLILLNYIFIFVFKFGFVCLPWVVVSSSYVALLVLGFCSWNYEQVQRSIVLKYDSRIMDGIQHFVALGLPGCLMLCAEWWAFELLGLLASFISTEAISAQSIILQVSSLAFMIPEGLGTASASLVGNALGANQKSLASKIIGYSFLLILCFELFIGFIILMFGSNFATIFTRDYTVLFIVRKTVPYLSFLVILDGFQGVGAGIMKGIGWQNFGAVSSLISYYTVGLPVAWLFCFYFHWGVPGLITGISLGTLLVALIYLTILLFTPKEKFVSLVRDT